VFISKVRLVEKIPDNYHLVSKIVSPDYKHIYQQCLTYWDD